MRSVNLGPSTTHFLPSQNTRVFLDNDAIGTVKLMLVNDSLVSAQTMPILYQLRQLRPKFHNLSSYIECQASPSLASRLEHQPATIWTLYDQDSLQAKPTQEKVGSMLFRSVALSAIRQGGEAVLHLNEVKGLAEMTNDTVVGKILKNIIDLFDKDTLPVIRNQPLNAKLTDLAAAVSKGNARENKKKMDIITETFYD
jgi:hypothetical protein